MYGIFMSKQFKAIKNTQPQRKHYEQMTDFL